MLSLSALRGVAKIARHFPVGARTILSKNCMLSDPAFNVRNITRSMFLISRNRGNNNHADGSRLVTEPWSNACSCGCEMHTKGDKELTAFLEEEIANETKAESAMPMPNMGDFECKYDGAEVTLVKKFNNETITVKANVSHSVDAEETATDPDNQKEEDIVGEMKAKPDFSIEIKKGKKVLAFECSFTEPSDQTGEDPYNDSFQITEISLHDGEFEDSTYSVSADIMDGYLYDLLMNYLEERGLSTEFGDRMVSLFTSYEHKLYINLLKGMKTFVEK